MGDHPDVVVRDHDAVGAEADVGVRLLRLEPGLRRGWDRRRLLRRCRCRRRSGLGRAAVPREGERQERAAGRGEDEPQDPGPRHPCAAAGPRGRPARRDRGRRDVLATSRGQRAATELARGRLAVDRVLGERPRHDGVEAGRHRRELGRPARLLVQVRPELGLVRVVGERRLAREHEEQHPAQRVHIRARIDRLAADLLRRDVIQGADPVVLRGRPACRQRGLGQAEVAQVDVLVVVDQHVGRLDVAMHVPRPVDRVQRIAQPLGDRRRAHRRQRTVPAHQRAQVVAADEPHDQIGAVALRAHGVDRHDVRVLHRRGRPGLGEEAAPRERVLRQIGRDHLQRDIALQLELAREVHDAHAALPDDTLDPAPSDDRAGSQHAHGPRIYDPGRRAKY